MSRKRLMEGILALSQATQVASKKTKPGKTPSTGKRKTKFKSVSSGEGKAVAMPYHTWFNHSLALLTPVVDSVYRGNSVYDPQYTIGGSSAYGFNQLTPLYKKFYVVGSRIKVQCNSVTANAPRGAIMVWADTNPTPAPDQNTACERCMAAGGEVKLPTTFYGAGTSTIIKYGTTKKLLNSGIQEDNNHGNGSTNPQEEWFWHCCSVLWDATVTKTFDWDVSIIYDTVWTESALNIGS